MGRPDWIDTRQHPEYPQAAYLVGVGTASNPDRDVAYQQAREHAIADIAGQLETHISSEVTSYVTESLTVQNDESATSLLSKVSSNVKAVATGSLKSIQPVEQAYDEATNLGAALVVIRRSDYARQAHMELADLDGKAGALLNEADGLAAGREGFQAVRRYTEVEDLLVKRAAVAANLEFVMPRGGPPKPGATLADVFAKRRETAKQVTLVLLCRHDAFGRKASTAAVEQRLLPQFASLGIVVKSAPREVGGEPVDQHWDDIGFLRESFGSDDGQPLLLLCDVLTTSRPAGHDDLIGVRSSGSARLLDANTGELLITASYSPDVASESPAIGKPERTDTLVDRSLALLAERLAGRVLEQI